MPEPIYAVGDVHGQIDELRRVLDLIEKDGGAEAVTVFLGDYVDRGPDSKAVVQALVDGTRGGRNWTCLKGNHDRYLERFVQDMTVYDPRTSTGLAWLKPRLGGDKTLRSYGVEADDGASLESICQQARQQVPQAHMAFLSGLPLYTKQTISFWFMRGFVLVFQWSSRKKMIFSGSGTGSWISTGLSENSWYTAIPLCIILNMREIASIWMVARGTSGRSMPRFSRAQSAGS